MALTDINFQEGEGQDFMASIPIGTSNPPDDILTEANGTYLLMETPLIVPGGGGGGNIFIMSE